MKTSAAREPKIGLLLREFKRKLFLYLLDYTKEMIDAIVLARHSDPLATNVINLLDAHVDGNYNDNRILSYMTERRRQVAAINKFYERTINQDTPQIGVYAKADIPRAMLTRQLVFVLSIAVLPDLEKDDFENYQMGEESDTHWYNNIDIVGEISKAWRNLRLFFQYNNYKRDSDFFIRFQPTTNINPQNIKLYEYGDYVEGFDLIKFLTSEEYNVNFQKDGNTFERNSDCFAGGDKITVTIG